MWCASLSVKWKWKDTKRKTYEWKCTFFRRITFPNNFDLERQKRTNNIHSYKMETPYSENANSLQTSWWVYVWMSVRRRSLVIACMVVCVDAWVCVCVYVFSHFSSHKFSGCGKLSCHCSSDYHFVHCWIHFDVDIENCGVFGKFVETDAKSTGFWIYNTDYLFYDSYSVEYYVSIIFFLWIFIEILSIFLYKVVWIKVGRLWRWFLLKKIIRHRRILALVFIQNTYILIW
jgi:hypothetical protein